MKHPLFFLVLLTVLTAPPLLAQTSIPRWSNVQVYENNTLLRNPGAGGFNVPEFSHIDLDQDGTPDLFVFDRSGRKVIPFLNGGTPGQVDYDFAPEYVSHFPQNLSDFALCRDFNCDGKADIFVGTPNGIRVYENTSTPGNLSFQLYADTLFTNYGQGPALIYLYPGDLPDMVDVDGDGDLDLLCFDQSGITVEWHKNMAVENTGNCAGLQLVIGDRCWGNFQENSFNQNLTLGYNCRTAPYVTYPTRPGVHSGSTLAAFDEEPDGDYELVIGDLLYNGLTYTHNAGTPVDAEVDSIDIRYPSHNVSVEIDIFPAGFFVDVNNDGKKDLIAAPNQTNVSVNYDNSWFYQNVHPGNGVTLDRINKNFLTEEMVDAGMCAYPALFDHNGDGLLDLVVGNYSRKLSASNVISSLALYENTGTSTQPVFTLVNRNYANLSNAFNPEIFGMSPAFGDLDGDGDQDLMIGDADGHLHYFENTAPLGHVASFPNPVAQYFNIDIGQFATPMIVDVDRDGDKDLVVGEMGGTLNYFENTGTAQSATFSSTPTDANWGNVDTEPVCCTGFSVPFIFENPLSGRYDMILGSEKGQLFYYQDFESELGGTFTLDQANFGEVQEGQRTAITGRDLTGDGDWEWMVGNVRGGLGFYSGNGIMMGSPSPGTLQQAQWEVFPNPSSGRVRVQVESKTVGRMHLTVTDIQGREMLHCHPVSAAEGAELDLSSLSPGMYFLRMDLNGTFAGVKRIDLLR